MKEGYIQQIQWINRKVVLQSGQMIMKGIITIKLSKHCIDEKNQWKIQRINMFLSKVD